MGMIYGSARRVGSFRLLRASLNLIQLYRSTGTTNETDDRGSNPRSAALASAGENGHRRSLGQ